MLNSLYNLDNPMTDILLMKTFSLSVVCPFAGMTMSFAIQKLFSFKGKFIIVGLDAYATWVLYRKSSPVLMSLSVFPSLFLSDSWHQVLC